VPLQQQQLLYNGKEMRNSEKLSALGVKDEDLVMMVPNVASRFIYIYIYSYF
jgi:DNA damage-inducible protein 1